MERFLNYIRDLEPYKVYFAIGEYISVAGSLYLLAARFKMIKCKIFGQPLMNPRVAIEVWVLKNIPYLIFLFLALIFGTSVIGRISNLLLFINVLIAYTFYPRNIMVSFRMTSNEFARQFLRNLFLVLYLTSWNTMFQKDSETFSTGEIIVITVGCSLFFMGMFVKMVYDCYVHPFATSDSTLPNYGGLFELVTSPNDLATVVQWFGYYLVSGNHISLFFFYYKAQVAIGKAVSRHIWYQENSPNYPPDRLAIFPHIY